MCQKKQAKNCPVQNKIREHRLVWEGGPAAKKSEHWVGGNEKISGSEEKRSVGMFGNFLNKRLTG